MSNLVSVSVAFKVKEDKPTYIGVHPTQNRCVKQIELVSRLESTNYVDVTRAIKLSEQTLINGDIIYGLRIDYLDNLPIKWRLYYIGDTGNQLLKEGDY